MDPVGVGWFVLWYRHTATPVVGGNVAMVEGPRPACGGPSPSAAMFAGFTPTFVPALTEGGTVPVSHGVGLTLVIMWIAGFGLCPGQPVGVSAVGKPPTGPGFAKMKVPKGTVNELPGGVPEGVPAGVIAVLK